MLEQYLQDIGLTDKEAHVYLTLLQVDGTTALDLSKKTNINRSTVYVTIESLSKKGLVSETTIGKKTQFQAESPERLETYVIRRQTELNEQAKRLKDVIPEIKSIQRTQGERPVVKYFEGHAGILSMLEEVFGPEKISDDEVIHLIYPKDKVAEIFSQAEKQKYKNMRLKRNIKSKAIYTSSEKVLPSDTMADRIHIDEEKYPIMCDITIYKDRLSISVLGDHLSGIFIKSKDLADTFRSLFALVFDNYKEIQS